MPRPLPEVNSSSQADIAFMLLIFFLVTTTMDVDSGISRVLPPAVDDQEQTDQQLHERNVLEVLVNSKDNLSVEGKRMRLPDLKDKVKEFFTNPNNDPNLPAKRVMEIEFFGPVEVSKGIISLKNARGTTYGMYIKVQNEIARAVSELRNSLSVQKFGKLFDDINADQQKAIVKFYPNAVSEAEPDETKID